MQNTILKRLQLILLACIVSCTTMAAGIPAATAQADPDAPVIVDGFYDAAAGEIDVWAIDGLAEQAWNVAFEASGSDGTTWHQALSGNGNWHASIPASQVGTGPWTVNAWANILSEPPQMLGSVSGYIDVPEASPRLLYIPSADFIRLDVFDVACPTGVQAVSAGITSPSGVTVWLPLSWNEFKWEAGFDPYQFGYEPGEYAIDIAIADNEWKGVSLPTKYQTLYFDYSDYGDLEIIDNSVQMWVDGPRAVHAWNVAFCVNGINGTQWLQAEQDSDGAWIAKAPLSQVGNGSFTAQPFFAVGSAPLTSMDPLVITDPMVQAVPMLVYAPNDDNFYVQIYDPQCLTGEIEAISVGLTGPDGTCEWFPIAHGEDVYWFGCIPANDYAYMSGTYLVDVAVADTDWNVHNAGRFAVDDPFDESLYLTFDNQDNSFIVNTCNGRVQNAWNVAFAINSRSGTFWIQGILNSENNVWQASLPKELENEFSGGIPITVYLNIGPHTIEAASEVLYTFG